MRLTSVLLVLVSSLCFINATPLDDYIALPDPIFSYKLNGTIKGIGYTAYIIRLTSQTWLTPADSDAYVWEHWLTTCVPDKVTTDVSFIYMDGGSTNDSPPSSVDPLTEIVCLSSNSVINHLGQIPDEPVIFAGDPGNRRTEDAMIAYTWWHFLHNTSEPFWLARLPMTKAAVRAMDTVQEFTAKYVSGIPPVKSFVIGGASKRGWTTWTTGAVDPRVIAIVPVVMPILNMIPNLNHQWQLLGEWSFALDDYLALGLMGYLNNPLFAQMTAIIDPFVYINRLTMPKYVICSTGDEFFPPDSTHYFWNNMLGESHLRMVPNAEHSLAGHQMDLALGIETFYRMVINGQPRPTVAWGIEYYKNNSATIWATTEYDPAYVKVWVADTLSHTMRDFRLLTCGSPSCFQLIPWIPKDLTATTAPLKIGGSIIGGNGNNTYTAFVEPPYQGWRGFMIELAFAEYNPPQEYEFKVTSEVYVVPNTFPFPPCGNNCQPSGSTTN
eukprot:TRINITY_DN2987_c0_g1_i1.p1 TRINITY_DN2987_c0_g1~~TRINITY_DN2987_c0_g1_i1.p1  ORF type:complete len:496 (+),score=111.08 TRINITY_DN2987_c0_g1_i1:188-1675(+)